MPAMSGAPSRPTRPALCYYGGKWRLAGWIVSLFGAHDVYVDAFGGAASVLLRKPRAYAEVYNDLDGELVNFFRVLREREPELRRALEMTPYARSEHDLSYEASADPLEQARRTAVRSWMSWGGNFTRPTLSGRTMRSGFRKYSRLRNHPHERGRGTAPAQDWITYTAALPAIAERLRGVIIEQKDAREVMARHDGPGTLHYVDPPYVHSTRGAGHDYRHELSDSDHEELLVFLGTLRGQVVLSGYRSDLYDRLLGGWRRVEKAARGESAVARLEVLWLKEAGPGGARDAGWLL